MKQTIYFLMLINFLYPAQTFAKLKVLTTTTTLKSVVESIGGPLLDVESITKGPQDPHFVEAKPSYMVRARQADLIVSVGLELEVGWLPNITRGARNPKIIEGNAGHLEAGAMIEPIETVSGNIDRSQGDIHALGNPHFMLDPLRAVKVAKGIALKLSELDPVNSASYQKNTQAFEKLIESELSKWRSRIQESKVKRVISYHKTLNYFLRRFDLILSGSIEPKPGIPPTAKQILSLIKTIENDRVNCLLIESFFETNAAERINKSVAVNIEVVPTEVAATKLATNYIELIEQLVSAVERCGVSKEKL